MNIEFRNNSNTNQLFGAALSNQNATSRNYEVNNLNIPVGTNLRVTAWKDYDWTNGVSTADLNLINKHILAVLPITNKWSMIAADANNNGTITTADFVALQKLILGTSTNLYNFNLRSWRFTNLLELGVGNNSTNTAFASFCHGNSNFAAAPFSSTANPPYFSSITNGSGSGGYFDMNSFFGTLIINSAIKNYYSFPVTSSSFFSLDFFGVKVGDINNNAVLNYVAQQKPSAIKSLAERRYADDNQFLQTNVSLKKGDRVKVPLYLLASQSLTHFQMGINFDFSKLKFLGHNDNPKFRLNDENNWGLSKVDSGRIRMLYIDLSRQPIPLEINENGEKIFTLEFEALSDISNLENLIQQYNDELPLSTYNDLEEVYHSSTYFDTEYVQSNIDNFAFYPNPFSDKISIKINSENNNNIDLLVVGIDGRKVFNNNFLLIKGENNLTINLADLVSGTYFIVQVDSKGLIKSRSRIIKI